MTTGPKPDPSAIGRIPVPPFARLPDPVALFAARAARLRRLAERHELAAYLEFLAGLAEVQVAIQEGLPPPEPPSQDAARAAHHAMPPLDRGGFAPDRRMHSLLDRLLEEMAGRAMPPEAQAALDRLRLATEAERAQMIADALEDAAPFEALAEHALVAAGLQVHFARLASVLDAAALKAVADGVCPACGGPPAASLIVADPPLPGARYCSCALCGTLWNYVRSKCTLCGSGAKISFREIDGRPEVKAELCGDCRGYVKVMYRERDPGLDPIADDVATVGLDLLLRELGFRRGAVNPFLTGY